MSRAVVVRAFGPPDTFEIEEQTLAPPGPGRVLIDIKAAGVSFVDVLVAAGQYQVRPTLPLIPGSECSGVIRAVGEGVTHLTPGDRVLTSAFNAAFAEQAVVPARLTHRISDDLPFEVAAVIRVSYGTVHYALKTRAALRPGETLLVLGAGGAIGYAAIQLGRAMGAKIIGSASTSAKRDLALAGGAHHVVDAGSETWRDDIKALNGGRGVDVVVDPIGGRHTELAFRSLAWNGRHLVIGFAAGEIPRLPVNLPLLKGAAMIGVDVRQFGIHEPQAAMRNIEEMLDLVSEAGLRPAIAAVYPLESFAEAMHVAASGDSVGRIVLTMGAV